MGGGARLLAGRCRGEISPLAALLSSHRHVVLFMPNECTCFVWLFDIISTSATIAEDVEHMQSLTSIHTP